MDILKIAFNTFPELETERFILREVKEHGCHMVHLDTFDFQSKDFYIKQGYEIHGVLDDCPKGHKRYYMKKNI